MTTDTLLTVAVILLALAGLLNGIASLNNARTLRAHIRWHGRRGDE